MSNPESTPISLPVPLEDGERVLWSSILQGFDEASAEAARASFRKLHLALRFISLPVFLYMLLRSGLPDMSEMSKILYGVLFIGLCWAAAGVFGSMKDRIELFLPKSFRQRVFKSCVITNRRVILFDGGHEAPTVLDRQRIDSADLDYAHGSRALVFRSESHTDSYTFIGTADLNSALSRFDSVLS